MTDPVRLGLRSTQQGILISAGLALVKLLAGFVGNSYALVADAIESMADVVSSLIVWGGLRVATREADDDYPFGYGKAESLATAVVAMFLLAAALTIVLEAIEELGTPHEPPAPWTLGVLVAVIVVKWGWARRLGSVGEEIGSRAMEADAWHHLGDALTSAAAFVGISLALVGGPEWAVADEWAAMAASLVIAWNGIHLLRGAARDLMDRVPEPDLTRRIARAARGVPGVLHVEKIAVRRSGLIYRVTLHVQAHPELRLDAAHDLSGAVKGAIKEAEPRVGFVLVHMEPFEGEPPPVIPPG